MKNKFVLTAFFLSFIIHHSAFVVSAATTVGAANHYAYAANLGWVDWRGDIANGAIMRQAHAEGPKSRTGTDISQ